MPALLGCAPTRSRAATLLRLPPAEVRLLWTRVLLWRKSQGLQMAAAQPPGHTSHAARHYGQGRGPSANRQAAYEATSSDSKQTKA